MEKVLMKSYFLGSQITHVLKLLDVFVMLLLFQGLAINLVNEPILVFSLGIPMVRKDIKFTI